MHFYTMRHMRHLRHEASRASMASMARHGALLPFEKEGLPLGTDPHGNPTRRRPAVDTQVSFRKMIPKGSPTGGVRPTPP